MASTRRRTSGFNSTPKEETENLETQSLEELLEPVQEVIEAEDKAESPVIAPRPFVEEAITPTEDAGPRFLKEEVAPTPPPAKVQPPELKPAPKRQPRNVPKFSRLR